MGFCCKRLPMEETPKKTWRPHKKSKTLSVRLPNAMVRAVKDLDLDVKGVIVRFIKRKMKEAA